MSTLHLLLLTAAVFAAQPSAPTAEEIPTRRRLPSEQSPQQLLRFLAESNASAIGLIHEVDFKLELELQLFEGPNATARPRHTETLRLSQRGSVKRVRNRSYATSEDGTVTTTVRFRDTIQEASREKYLSGWNPDSPPLITPLEQHGVHGVIRPRRPAVSARDPAEFLFLGFAPVGENGSNYSLTELVEQASRAEVLGRPAVDGRELWLIRVFNPNREGLPDSRSYKDFFLDPSVNFMVRKRVVHWEDAPYSDPDGASSTSPADLITEITEFEDLGDGVFFPVAMVHRWSRPELYGGKQLGELRGQVVDLTVNTILPPDALNFAFPENLLVRHYPPVDGKLKVEVWGPDNEPLTQLTGGLEQLLEIAGVDRETPAAWPKARLLWMFGINAVVVGALFFLWILSRRKGRVAK